jgi:hypothetical protein
VSVAATSNRKGKRMRNFVVLLGLAFVLSASPAFAGDFLDASATNAKAGAEAVLTSPVAPAFGVFYGDPVLNLPCAPVTDRLVGLVTGSVAGAFSLATGLVDIVFALPAGIVGIEPVSPVSIVDLFQDGDE